MPVFRDIATIFTVTSLILPMRRSVQIGITKYMHLLSTHLVFLFWKINEVMSVYIAFLVTYKNNQIRTITCTHHRHSLLVYCAANARNITFTVINETHHVLQVEFS